MIHTFLSFILHSLLLYFSLLLVLFPAHLPGVLGDDGTLIHTPLGDVQGMVSPSFNIREFWSIPFAHPPVSDNRWQPPQPITAYPSSPYLATNTTIKKCTQANGAVYTGSEDCLYLSVYVPAVSTPVPSGGFPVLVWIYGGAFLGSDYEDARSWVGNTQAFIYVVISYRLGIFGFLSLPELSAEQTPYAFSGDQGLQDQSAALQWIHNNIGFFSGNPNQVTIMGESAGGHSVCLHLIMPRSRGLFSAAIIQSHGCDEFIMNQEDTETELHDGVVNQTICVGKEREALMDCLRSLDTETLFGIQNHWPQPAGIIAHYTFYPTINGVIIVFAPRVSYQYGQFAAVPVLLGSNTGEAAVYLYTQGPNHQYNWTWADLDANVNYYGHNNATLVQWYHTHYAANDLRTAFIDAFSDQRFVCATKRVADTVALSGLPVYLYQYNYIQQGDSYRWLNRSVHGAELHLIFNTTSSSNGWTAEDRVFSAQMQNLWMRFIVNHNPNTPAPFDAYYAQIYGSAGLPTWPLYIQAQQLVLQMHNNNDTNKQHFQTGDHVYRSVCELWDDNVWKPVQYPRHTHCWQDECRVIESGGKNVCIDEYNGDYQCQCGNGWIVERNGHDCVPEQLQQQQPHERRETVERS